MASFEPDEIDFEDQYDKLDPIDDADLDTSMNELNESMREQEELENRITRAEWTSTNKDQRTKLEQQIAFNKKKQELYIMRASKTIISILHRGFDKIKQDGRVMVLDEKYDNMKQFARELNKLPTTSEGNQDNIMLQDIITKNEIATDNSMKLIETSLTDTGEDASTQTGGLTLRELEGLDKELRTISGSLRSAITKSIAKQVDIDRENRKLEEMANDETYSDEKREEVRARLQRFQDEQKAISDQIRILKG